MTEVTHGVCVQCSRAKNLYHFADSDSLTFDFLSRFTPPPLPHTHSHRTCQTIAVACGGIYGRLLDEHVHV